MSITFYYANVETAHKIIKAFKVTMTPMEVRELTINTVPYLKITIHSRNNNIPDIELNEPKAIALAMDNYGSKMVLQYNKLTTAINEDSYKGLLHEYRIIVFNLEPLRIYKREIVSKAAGWVRLSIDDPNNRELKKIKQTACHALQVLGLDFGSIHIGVNKLRKLVILKIEPSPYLSGKRIEAFVDFITDFLEGKYFSTDVVLGADPEFVMVENGNDRLVMASALFPRQGTIGCDNWRIPNRQQRPIAEIRPEPSSDPVILIENIYKSLKKAAKLAPYRNLRWLAGSLPVEGIPIGGHIHFSNIKPSSKLLRALDNYLAIPVFLMENPQNSVKRREKYGMLSDYRLKEYGGFEYRTLSSWLITPEIATGVLCLARLIALNYPKMTENIFIKPEAHEAFYQGNKLYYRDYFDRIWKTILDMPEAELYRSQLKVIYDICTNHQNWDENINIRETWGLPVLKKVYRAGSTKNSTTARVSVRIS